jgi:hypothetical protein
MTRARTKRRAHPHPRAYQPEAGERFGRLVALKRADDYVHPRGDRCVRWTFLCDCGARVRMRPTTARWNVRRIGWCSCRACYFEAGGWDAIAARAARKAGES